MRKLCLALLCLAPALSWTQNEAYVLAKQLVGLSSLTLNFEHNEANLDESSLYSFYGAVNDLYGATEIQICYDAKTFEERRNDLGARRKQWLMDLIRQEQIELLSENMHPLSTVKCIRSSCTFLSTKTRQSAGGDYSRYYLFFRGSGLGIYACARHDDRSGQHD